MTDGNRYKSVAWNRCTCIGRQSVADKLMPLAVADMLMPLAVADMLMPLVVADMLMPLPVDMTVETPGLCSFDKCISEQIASN